MRMLMLTVLLALVVPHCVASPVVVVPIKGEVSNAQFYFLRRAVKQAEKEKAEALVLDMDTYGGDLEAAVKMLNVLSRTSLPTYTYINDNAGSAGALLALCTKHIYMGPVSAIGAAAPVSGGGQELPKTLNEKIISYFSKKFSSAAERNGHNPDIAEAFINKEKEVKIGDVVVHAKGNLLSLSAKEATRKINGKPVLAEGIAENMEALLSMNRLSGPIQTIHPTGFEQIAFWVTTLAPLFLLGGILGAYIEIKTPGFGIPGMISIVCFTIFFTGHYLAGLAGWEVVILFVVGLALLVSELFVHPGTILPGVIGVFLILGALIWAMVDRYPGEPLLPTAQMLWGPVLNLTLAAILVAISAAFLVRYLPKTSLYNRLVLGASNPAGPSMVESVASPVGVSVGDQGVALSMLRPSGNAFLNGRHVDVVTQGLFVEAKTNIRVIAVEGARIVVEPI